MKLKNNKAITLIALIITIIVLLILAGVTIVTLTGENGLLNRAKEAKKISTNSSVEENTTLADYENKIEDYSNMKNNEIEIINSEKDLLIACGISDIYTNSEITSNQDGILEKILENNMATDYIISNPTNYLTGITNSSSSMETLGKSDYASTRAIEDEEWINAIMESTYTNYFDIGAKKVPTMTSNTTPSGECFSTKSYNGLDRYSTYKCFDNADSSDFAYNGKGECYIGYRFDEPVNVYKFSLIQRGADGNGLGNEGLNDITLYYSDDGVNYVAASEKYVLNKNASIQKFLSYFPGKHIYWKIVSSSGYGSNGGLNYLQFFAK